MASCRISIGATVCFGSLARARPLAGTFVAGVGPVECARDMRPLGEDAEGDGAKIAPHVTPPPRARGRHPKGGDRRRAGLRRAAAAR